MDSARFDTLTRLLTDARSRRGVLTAVLGGSLGLSGLIETDAKRRKRKHKHKKKKKKKCPSSQKRCGTTCIPSNQCCADGDCAAGAPRCCQGTCIRTTDCCTDAECSNDRVCQEGTCSCPAGTVTCPSQCCQAAPGFVARSVVCGMNNSCVCDYEINDNPGKCAGTCIAGCGVTTDCTTPLGMCGFCCS